MIDKVYIDFYKRRDESELFRLASNEVIATLQRLPQDDARFLITYLNATQTP